MSEYKAGDRVVILHIDPLVTATRSGVELLGGRNDVYKAARVLELLEEKCL